MLLPQLRHFTLFALFIALVVSSSVGCGSRVSMRRINSAQRKPGNVWVFFTVKKGKAPVPGLTAEDFGIYEDDSRVSSFESQQIIQNPQVASVMYTALLLDVSGSITESGQIDALVDAAELFIERVGKTQKVAVYAFDGAKKLHAVVPFTAAEGRLQGGLNALRRYKPRDLSTNLHGAVVQGLRRLDKGLSRDKRPLKFGTLVVFSDGSDRAARVSRREMLNALSEPRHRDYEIFAIGIGEEAELEQARLQDIGRNGTELAFERGKIKIVFDRIATQIESHSKRFYLLSYCTPARKGPHTVRIVLNKPERQLRGELSYSFSADGFGPPPRCRPERKPTFNLKNVGEAGQ